MPIADLKRNNVLVRFRWSYHKDIVHVHGHFGIVVPDQPVKNEKMKKTKAQKYWKELVAAGFEPAGIYPDRTQIK